MHLARHLLPNIQLTVRPYPNVPKPIAGITTPGFAAFFRGTFGICTDKTNTSGTVGVSALRPRRILTEAPAVQAINVEARKVFMLLC